MAPPKIGYGQGMGVVAITIFSLETTPLLGAFGSDGAMAVTGPKALHAMEKGSVVRVYCAVDSAGTN